MSAQQCLTTVAFEAYYWNPEFIDGQPHGYDAQDQRYVERMAQSWAENAPENDFNIRLVDGLIKTFYSILGDTGAPHGPSGYQRPEVESFCGPGSLSTLENGIDPRVLYSRALLDDRCRVTPQLQQHQPGGRRRLNRGPLNPTQLLHELRKKRYGCADEPDAARRLLFVADPNSWVILALMLTSSHQQTLPLTDFFYKYLGFRTALGIHIPTRGIKFFALEFHLHFYVWRDSETILEDWRKKRDGQPLRRSRQLRAFDTENPNGDDGPRKTFVYEAQVSCLITGLDHDSWVAYMFVDTYYQRGDSSESAEQYHSRANVNYQPDPLRCGNEDANFPIWTPREYFLAVYESRLGQVKHALHTLTSKLILKIQPYMDDAMDLLNGDGTLLFGRKKKVQQVASEATRLLQQTIHSISSAVEVWDRFSNQDAAYLKSSLEPRSNQHSDRSIPPIRIIALIVHHINALRDLQRRAEKQQELCTGVARELEIQISMEDSENSKQQQRTGEFVKMLTGVGIVFIPFTATAAILSMQPGVLPPELVSGRTFLICWTTFTALVAAGVFWNGLFSLSQLGKNAIIILDWFRIFSQRHVRRTPPIGASLPAGADEGESAMYTDDVELSPLRRSPG